MCILSTYGPRQRKELIPYRQKLTLISIYLSSFSQIMRTLGFKTIRALVQTSVIWLRSFISHLSQMVADDGSGVRLYDGPDIKLFILVGLGRSFLSVAWPTGVQLVFFFCSGVSRLFGAQGSPSSGILLSL